MIKIKPFYQNDNDLREIQEPYKSVALIIDKLRLPYPNIKNVVSQSFLNTFALSCIRDIAEDLVENSLYFANRLITIWSNLYSSSNVHFSNRFDNYGVPNQRYQGIIFGGVYYALATQQSVDDEKLDMFCQFMSGHTEAMPYFSIFKEAAEKKAAETGDQKKSGRKGETAKLTPAQAGLFCEAFLDYHNCTYNNKKETIAPLASSLFGWTKLTMERNLSNATKEDRECVAGIFENIDQKFSNHIKCFGKKEAQINTPSGESKKGGEVIDT